VATNDDDCNCNKNNDVLMTVAVDLSGFTFVYMSFASFFYYGYYDAQENAYVRISTDGGSSWTTVKTLSGGIWNTELVDLSDYAGNSNVMIGFKYSDGGGWNYGWAIDDLKIYEPLAGPDISVSSVHVGAIDPTPTFVDYPKSLVDRSLEARAYLLNKGTEPITSFDFEWSDGINSYSQSFSGISVDPLTTYEVIAEDEYLVQSGSHVLTFSFGNINGGSNDPDQNDNAGTFTVEGVTPDPDKVYLVEERTGTWCGWCVRGIIFMDYMRATYPDKFIGIAVHNGDPMKNTTYDNGINAYANYFPSAVGDRVSVIDPAEMEQNFLERIDIVPSVKLNATASYNVTSGELTVHAEGYFTQNLSGDYRFNAILVEDSVQGTTSGYDQANYYSISTYGNSGPMGGFEDMDGTIDASEIYYMQVGRDLLSDPATFKGQPGSLPSTINAGETHSYDFTYSVPSTYNINHCTVVVTANKYSTDDILNATAAKISITTGVDNTAANAALHVYPNPASSEVVLNMQIPNAVDVSVDIFNQLGQVVESEDYGIISGLQNMKLDASSWPAGIYEVRVKSGDQFHSKKLVIGR
jgi:hypothetical protein